MKKLFTTILILFSLQSFSQVTKEWVLSEIKKSSGEAVYDTVLVRKVKNQNVDTLFAPTNTTVSYQLSINGDGLYLKDIAITNNNGKYSYTLGTGGFAWKGYTGTKINFVIGKGIIIQLISTSANYTYQRLKHQ